MTVALPHLYKTTQGVYANYKKGGLSSKLETLKVSKGHKHGVLAQEIIEAAARASDHYNIPHGLLLAIIEKESRGNIHAKRFEPKVASKLQVTIDRDDLASSHGLMQVMGYHAKFCELDSWRDLYDVDKNIACGSKILRQNFKRLPAREAIVAYNGKGKRAEQYASNVIERWKALEVLS